MVNGMYYCICKWNTIIREDDKIPNSIAVKD